MKRQLGEVALSVHDLDAMTHFYCDVIGLERMDDGRFPHARFLRIAEGLGGHTQILALFDREAAPEGNSSLDHWAIALTTEDWEQERARLEALGLSLSFQDHAWVGWRSLYVVDPEGNLFELVCRFADPDAT